MVSLYRDPNGDKVFAKSVLTWIHHTIDLAQSETVATQQESNTALKAEITELKAKLAEVRVEFCIDSMKHSQTCASKKN